MISFSNDKSGKYTIICKNSGICIKHTPRSNISNKNIFSSQDGYLVPNPRDSLNVTFEFISNCLDAIISTELIPIMLHRVNLSLLG